MNSIKIVARMENPKSILKMKDNQMFTVVVYYFVSQSACYIYNNNNDDDNHNRRLMNCRWELWEGDGDWEMAQWLWELWKSPYLKRSHSHNSPASHPSTKPSELDPEMPIPLRWSTLILPQTWPTPEMTSTCETTLSHELPSQKDIFYFMQRHGMGNGH